MEFCSRTVQEVVLDVITDPGCPHTLAFWKQLRNYKTHGFEPKDQAGYQYVEGSHFPYQFTKAPVEDGASSDFKLAQ